MIRYFNTDYLQNLICEYLLYLILRLILPFNSRRGLASCLLTPAAGTAADMPARQGQQQEPEDRASGERRAKLQPEEKADCRAVERRRGGRPCGGYGRGSQDNA